ncbi:MAG: glutamine--fructose-6-phosphate transaminase (isomerizing) [Gammaproteobacteria bacterium]|nr:glutamine--fructose-6-phosphate transaminase (isomerizing) [Gammaproteobacteria bacterium]
MCGIVGANAERDVVPILLEGLRRLEYRGYDSAGIAVVDVDGKLDRERVEGKVQGLADRLQEHSLKGHSGIAHTRWATHGAPSESNAHPHFSGDDIALVHNGIIENYEKLRTELKSAGYEFTSETDSEVVAHLVHQQFQQDQDLFAAVQRAVKKLHGAYALVVTSPKDRDVLVTARMGCPVVIGHGIGENFVASDVSALLPVTRRFSFLEEGDVACVRKHKVEVIDKDGKSAERPQRDSELSADAVERGEYRHYMLKEIYEQPRAIAETLEERLTDDHVLEAAFGVQAGELLKKVEQVQIIACGTSYHAGMVARYYIEKFAKVPCQIEVASEYRYRDPVVTDNTLFVTISQSGETADTLAALRMAKDSGYLASLAICNVPESSLVRESDLVLMTRAGPEIGVASTKAFTTQLVALVLLTVVLARIKGNLDKAAEKKIVGGLRAIASSVEEALQLDDKIAELSEQFVEKHHALFLGRGVHYPIALEGALKLKEISYIHAEAYPSGELKHGPLALVDADMPVIAVAPNDELVEKLKANLQEVRARGGQLYIFADPEAGIESGEGIEVIHMPKHYGPLTEPIVYTIPLQLLSYHVAVLKGTDVDKPRNLAKSVTVE